MFALLCAVAERSFIASLNLWHYHQNYFWRTVWTKLTCQLGTCSSFTFLTFICFFYALFLSIFSKGERKRSHTATYDLPIPIQSLNCTHTLVSCSHCVCCIEQRSADSAKWSPSQSVLQEVNVCIYALWVVPGFNNISIHHIKFFKNHIVTSLAHLRDSLVHSLIFSGGKAIPFFSL